jgi:hypothetical protein
MAHIWTSKTEGEWAMQTLTGEISLSVSARGEVRVAPPSGQPLQDDIRVLPPDAAGVSPSWTLFGGWEASIFVNGQPLALGLRALRDRDEILFAGQRCFFSMEELARVVPFPGLTQAAYCPRCKQKVEPAEPAVACPHCRAWHHQSEKFPCWTYGSTCALCQLQSTALDAGYEWTPELL